jgi:hypothetical protein
MKRLQFPTSPGRVINIWARRTAHPAGSKLPVTVYLVPGVPTKLDAATFIPGIEVEPAADVHDAGTAYDSNEAAGLNRPDVIPMVRPRQRQPVCQKCRVEEATQIVKGQRRCQYCTFGGGAA